MLLEYTFQNGNGTLRPRAIGGAKWEPLKKEGLEPSAAAVLSRQLTEMATYLLVWGEAWKREMRFL